VTLPTDPLASPAPPPLPPPPPPSPVQFPLGWLLQHAAPPIQYRAIHDVARLPNPSPLLPSLVFSFKPALSLASSQDPDGTWNRAMLTVPSRNDEFGGVGTISAFRRLLEYGWDREAPPLRSARRILFRLLAEDDDPNFLFELAPKGRTEDEIVKRGRLMLREAAAAALAQAGYEDDPRLRGAARRILDRLDAFVRSPLGEKPWIRVGNKQVLAPEATPPSVYALTMLAFMPLFRNEHSVEMDNLFRFLSQPLPRQESQQLIGTQIVSQPHLVLGDILPHRNAADADVPSALTWLELVARMQFLRRNDNWSRLFDRFLDDRDRDFVWHPHKGLAMPRSSSPYVWPMFPLETASAGDERWTDVTFRLGLIARLSGRPIEVV
jgi:hypothetical protein